MVKNKEIKQFFEDNRYTEIPSSMAVIRAKMIQHILEVSDYSEKMTIYLSKMAKITDFELSGIINSYFLHINNGHYVPIGKVSDTNIEKIIQFIMNRL